ncbi:MAG TPA: hypothetical protein VGC76_14550 [Pyrinomonadaceae bacterium]|jgi:hypothetical protein
MPLLIEKTTGGTAYASPFLSNLGGNVIHVKVDVSLLSTSQVDEDGILKPGVVLPSHGGAFGSPNGTAQVETQTVVGTANGAGNVKVTITSELYEEPIEILVAVADTDNAAAIGGKIRTALGADSRVTDYYTVGGAGANYSLTAKTIGPNDISLNLAHAQQSPVTGITAASNSTNSTAGVAPDDAVMVISPTKIAASNTSLSSITNDPLVACATIATVNRSIVEDNLGRSLTAVELAAIKNSGLRLTAL